MTVPKERVHRTTVPKERVRRCLLEPGSEEAKEVSVAMVNLVKECSRTARPSRRLASSEWSPKVRYSAMEALQELVLGALEVVASAPVLGSALPPGRQPEAARARDPLPKEQDTSTSAVEVFSR